MSWIKVPMISAPMLRRLVVGAILTTSVALAGSCSTVSSNDSQLSTDVTESSTSADTTPFSYDLYEEVLATYVDDQGLVDYKGLQQNRDALDQFNASIGDVSPETYAGWSDAEKMAFLINAYNAFTLQSIIDQEPLSPAFGIFRGCGGCDSLRSPVSPRPLTTLSTKPFARTS